MVPLSSTVEPSAALSRSAWVVAASASWVSTPCSASASWVATWLEEASVVESAVRSPATWPSASWACVACPVSWAYAGTVAAVPMASTAERAIAAPLLPAFALIFCMNELSSRLDKTLLTKP